MCCKAQKSIGLRLDEELLARVDSAAAATDTPRAAWIARACQERLSLVGELNGMVALAADALKPNPLGDAIMAAVFPERRPVRPSPMVGQLGPRSSSQSKSGVRPIPKGKP